MSKVFAFLTKFVSWPVEHFYFKKKVYYENSKHSQKIKGGALIVSNHKSVYDYPLIMYTFMPRQVYCLIGENIYAKKALAPLIKAMGNIKVSRQDKNFDFMDKTVNLLKKGNLCLVFPESRLHTDKDDPNTMLPFKSSFVHIALSANVPIIPVYTNGIYGKQKRKQKSNAKVVVGQQIYLSDLYDNKLSYEQNIINLTNYVQNYIANLGKTLTKDKDRSKLSQIFDPKMLGYDFAKWTGCLPALIGYRTKKIYCNGASRKDIRGSYLISSNHVTYTDPLILLTAFQSRRICFLVAKEVYRNKWTKFWFDMFNCIKVDRENPDYQTFNKVKDTIKRGHPIVVFPEAHVYKHEHKLQYHKGIVLMSIMANVPILPVYIVRRQKATKRQLVLIGPKIYWRKHIKGSTPTLDEINMLTKLVVDETNKLKLEHYKNNKVDNSFIDQIDQTIFKHIVDLETIPELLDHISKTYSSHIAYSNIDGHHKTFNQLVLDVRKTITVLKQKDIQPKQNVGIYLPNSYEFVVTSLAVMAYGATAVLLPSTLNKEALNTLEKKFDVVTTISSNILDSNVEPSQFNSVEPSQAAAILLTGGTTGTPKGVVLSHTALLRGTINGVLGLPNPFYETYFCIIPFTHSFGFVRNMLCCLYTGSKMCINTNKMELFKELSIYKPTILCIVPSLAEMFLNLIKTQTINIVGGRLKTIICGAANVSPYLTLEYANLGINLCPGYGLTEFANLVSGNPRPTMYPNSVGLLFPQQEAKIVDGELWLKGRNMMLGYYKDELNNSLAITKDGWFKTGDLAKFDKDNNLYILGRISDEIVFDNGFKVSPAQLEATIAQNSLVKDCLVYKKNNSLVAEATLRISVMQQQSINTNQAHDLIWKDIENMNKSNPEYMHILSLTIRDKDFERSPNMKIIRPRG